MGWEKDYERWRDMGHTWGPGIDDRREPTPEEIAENEAQRKAYEEKIASVRVEPRENVRLAGEKLTNVKVPYALRQQYSDARLDCAKKVAQSLGYELKLSELKDRNPDKFMVSVEYHGNISGLGGNIHRFSVSNIDNIKDCLQLVADFSALGYWSTTWYKNNHISLNQTGVLRLEMVRWGFPLEQDNKKSIDEQINIATNKVNGPKGATTERTTDQER